MGSIKKFAHDFMLLFSVILLSINKDLAFEV